MQIYREVQVINFFPDDVFEPFFGVNQARCKRKYFTTCKGFLYTTQVASLRQ